MSNHTSPDHPGNGRKNSQFFGGNKVTGTGGLKSIKPSKDGLTFLNLCKMSVRHIRMGNGPKKALPTHSDIHSWVLSISPDFQNSDQILRLSRRFS